MSGDKTELLACPNEDLVSIWWLLPLHAHTVVTWAPVYKVPQGLTGKGFQVLALILPLSERASSSSRHTAQERHCCSFTARYTS
jgi:hypothetical protein